VEPEDVVHVLRRFRDVLRPDGLILDLQVIRPNPLVEADGQVPARSSSTTSKTPGETLPAEWIPRLLARDGPCAVRERCRTRRLRSAG
jgi:hypothetical protein